MAIGVSTNTTANTALRYLDKNSHMSASSLSKLSSGSRIVRASDDAAGLAVGTTLRADVAALKQAQVNASHGVSLLQVADGGLSQVSDILMRMKTLTVQAQSGSVGDQERGFIDKEFQALMAQLNAIGDETQFSGVDLLNGTLAIETSAVGTAIDGSGTVSFEVTGSPDAATYTIAYDTATGEATVTRGAGVGAESQTVVLDNTDTAFTGAVDFSKFGIEVRFAAHDLSATAVNANNTFVVTNGALKFQVGVDSSETIDVDIPSIKTDMLGDAAGPGTLADADGLGNAASVATRAEAIDAGDILDVAIAQTNEARADVGAMISRFEFAAANLAVSVENLDAARSLLLDVDMAAEMANFSSKQVMMQASVSMLAQANQMPQHLLKLLG